MDERVRTDGDSVMAPVSSPIDLALADFDDQIEELGELVEQIGKRIAPVLATASPDPVNAHDKVGVRTHDDELCPLGLQIEQLRAKHGKTLNSLVGVWDRLQL